MKLSCIPVSYFKEIIKNKKSIYEWAAEAKEIGFNYIDLSILFFQQIDKYYFFDIKKQLDRLNISIGIINTYTNYTHPNSTRRRNELYKIKDYIKAAEILGAEYIRITAGQAYPQVKKEDGLRWVVDSFLKAAEYTKNTNVKLVFENHSKPGVWDYWDFCFPTEIFLEIYKQVKGSQIKILFDTANAIAASSNNPLILLEEVAEDLACIHVSDILSRVSFKPVIIGTGIVPIKKIFKKLRELGFGGIISIEEASFTGKSGIEIAQNYITKIWKEYGEQ